MAEEQKKSGRKFRVPPNWRNYLVKALIFIGAFLFAFRGYLFAADTHDLAQAELVQKAQQGQVTEVAYKDDTHLTVTLKGDTTEWKVTYPKAIAEDTFKSLNAAHVDLKPEKSKGFPWGSVFTFLMIIIWSWLIIESLVPVLRTALAKARGQGIDADRPKITFDDVKGLTEVVGELKDIATILKYPERFAKLGARPPAGLVLYGPPGTGKTLLARALAGEAGVPFYEVTGSSVRSKWIGQAGKAIKAYFEQARRNRVSIVFFDEGDTIGGRRGEGTSGGDQEHRAMVNELLAQMDPNRSGGIVFVIIATNNPDLLDEALTRPGRIDLKLAVLPPDVNGREAILKLHTEGKPLAPDVDLRQFAKEMYGHTGAALQALVNAAALKAGIAGAVHIGRAHFEDALTVMQTGPARKDAVVSVEDKRVTAFHEAGHALCAAVLNKVPSPTSITILGHGYSGGHTMITPDETASQYTSKEAAKQTLTMLMAGVAGEKLALNADFTNGAASDREKATDRAVEMICEWGMGTYNSVFGPEWPTGPHADQVWEQVEALLDAAEAEAIRLILLHKTAFDALVAELLEKETLRATDLLGYRPEQVSDEEFDNLKERFSHVIGSIETRVTERRAWSDCIPVGAAA